MRRHGIHPDLMSFTALISAFGRAGAPDRAQRTFDEMRAAGVAPNEVTYLALLDAYGKVRTGAINARAFLCGCVCLCAIHTVDSTVHISSHALHVWSCACCDGLLAEDDPVLSCPRSLPHVRQYDARDECGCRLSGTRDQV